MTQEEKFAIWDATNPEIKEVRAYLDRLCGKTPLPLLYRIENGCEATKEVIVEKAANLFGILLDENNVVYLRALTKDDCKSLYDCDDAAGLVTEEDINAWLKKQFTDLPNVRAATEKDIKLLDRKRSDFFTTLDILLYHGLKTPKPLHTRLGWLGKDAYNIQYWDGAARICHYLEYYGDLLIFSDYSDNKIAQATVRHQYFQSAGI